jgi:hypothetical protein
MLNAFGLGDGASKTHSSNGGKGRTGKGKVGKKGGGVGESGDGIVRSTRPVAPSKPRDEELIAFLHQQVLTLELTNAKLAKCLLLNATPREFFWVLKEFKWSQKLWVSDPFSFADRVWSLSFGPTESGDFGTCQLL